ncbi:MAG: hypothetical protein M3483_08010 [Gemmatimonadota bacterium]|nr:hypothetical protein [Gemmatimonadota bacterium]
MTSRSDALRQRKRLLIFTGALLALQIINSLLLWRLSGRFPLWAGVAIIGLAVFTGYSLIGYRRVQRIPPETPRKGTEKKRRRMRDPHRKRA